jgi:hypothetical protein
LPAELRALADELATDPADLPDDAKAERVMRLAMLAGRIDAALAHSVGVFDANTVWAGSGARSCGGWIAARTELSREHAGAVTRLARRARACPQVDAAWSAGVIGTAKVRALVGAREIHPELFASMEAQLIDWVAPLTVAQASRVIASWSVQAEATAEAERRERAGDDPDAGDPPPDPALENRLHLSRSLDGRYLGSLDLDAVAGAEVDGAITAWIDRAFQLGIYRSDDGLTLSQRKAEALVALTGRGATPGQTNHGDPRPSVAISIDSRTLEGIPATSLDDALARSCSLDDGTPILRASAERLLCTARVAAMVVRIASDGSVETLGITELLRDANRRQRRALRIRDGGCVFPGCDAPPDWCEAHHVLSWEDGGPTLLHNPTSR